MICEIYMLQASQLELQCEANREVVVEVRILQVAVHTVAAQKIDNSVTADKADHSPTADIHPCRQGTAAFTPCFISAQVAIPAGPHPVT